MAMILMTCTLLLMICKSQTVTEKTWDQSKASCQGKGEILMVISSEAQNQAITTTSVTSLHWIGLHKVSDIWGVSESGFVFEWDSLTHTEQTMSVGVYRKWGTNEPNAALKCVAFNPSTREWLTQDCSKTLPFLCGQRPLIPAVNVHFYTQPLATPSTFLNFDQGKAACASRGELLLYITNDLENLWILKNVASKFENPLYLGKRNGVYEYGKTNEWDGLYHNYRIWYSNDVSLNANPDSCYFFNRYSSGQRSGLGGWVQGKCTDTQPIICRPRPVVDGYIGRIESPKLHKTWNEAASFCQGDKDALVYISSDAENNYIRDSITINVESSYWIGLRQVNGVFVWDSLTPEQTSSVVYRKWGTNEPNSAFQCVALNPMTGEWFTQDCNKKLPFVCRRKLATPAPTSMPTRSKAPTRNPSSSPSKTPTKPPTKKPSKPPTRNPSRNPTKNPTTNPSKAPTRNPTRNPTGNPTRNPSKAPTTNPTKAPTKKPKIYYVGPETTKNWIEAKQKCEGFGDTLAVITSAADQSEAWKLCKPLAVGESALGCWIGLNDKVTEGTFQWTTGLALGNGYNNWANGEPNDANGEDCVHMRRTDDGKWNDLPCDGYKLRYICQRDATPKGYFVGPGSVQNWNDAKVKCEGFGHNLAVITSASDQNEAWGLCKPLLATAVKDWGCWIGLNDKVTEGTMQWTTGLALGNGYSNWGGNEPNDAIGNEDCVEMRGGSFNGKWNDLPCLTIQIPYICLKKTN